MAMTDTKHSPDSTEPAANALAKVEAEMAALQPTDLAPINVDIPRAVATALGARPALFALRPRIVKELPYFPIASLDELDTYALAAWYAHLLSLPAKPNESAHKPLVSEATALRSSLLVAAQALAHRNLVDPAHVEQIRRGLGHIDLASDLVALATLFTNSWSDIEGKTTVTLLEVERAQTLGPELLAAIGVRDGAVRRPASQLADRRRRAFTLFARAYDDCRQAVGYLRWKAGDAAKLAPSLAGPRTKPRNLAPASPPDASPPVEPASKPKASEPGCG